MSALPLPKQDAPTPSVSLATAVQRIKAARAAMTDLEAQHKRHQVQLWDAEEAIRTTLTALDESRVVLGDDLIEVVETTPGRKVVLVSHVLVLP